MSRRVRNRGSHEEAARSLTVLRVRGLQVSDAARERILAQKNPERLERWLEQAIVATFGRRGPRRAELRILETLPTRRLSGSS